jgi:hypothetical protein
MVLAGEMALHPINPMKATMQDEKATDTHSFL